MDMLKINESLSTDESIEEYEYHEYEPITGANLNNPGEIRINVQTQDIFYHPSESYLIFEGRLTKADGTAYANGDVVTLTNNGLMHLFSNIKYQLSGQEIESLYYPGQATTMMGLLKYPDDFQKSQGLNCGTKTRALPRISLTIPGSVLDTDISLKRQILREPLVLEFPSSIFLVLPKIMIKSYTDSDTS